MSDCNHERYTAESHHYCPDCGMGYYDVERELLEAKCDRLAAENERLMRGMFALIDGSLVSGPRMNASLVREICLETLNPSKESTSSAADGGGDG